MVFLKEQQCVWEAIQTKITREREGKVDFKENTSTHTENMGLNLAFKFYKPRGQIWVKKIVIHANSKLLFVDRNSACYSYTAHVWDKTIH